MILPEIAVGRTAEMARPQRRGVSRRTVIEEAKAKVETVDLAEDRSPSFTVYPETDSFFCYGCLVGGDIVELARHAWGYPKEEVAMAAAQLLHEFGHEIPRRPTSWHRKQTRQERARRAVEDALVR